MGGLITVRNIFQTTMSPLTNENAHTSKDIKHNLNVKVDLDS